MGSGEKMRMAGTAEILLVEDRIEEAELTMAALKARGFGNKVVHFLDGDGVLEFLCVQSWSVNWSKGTAPRLILLDLNLRHIGGIEVLQQLKVRERTRPIPVVVFTGAHDDEQMLSCYRLGANSYVVKPAEAAQFRQLVGDMAYYWLQVNRPFN